MSQEAEKYFREALEILEVAKKKIESQKISNSRNFNDQAIELQILESLLKEQIRDEDRNHTIGTFR